MLRSHLLSCLFVVAVVLLGNGLNLSGKTNPNPVNQLAGITAHITPGPVSGYNFIDPNVGVTAQALGHRAAEDVVHGSVPWWNQYEGLGTPLAAEMQSAAFFPPNLLNLLPNGQVLFRILLEITAGIATYLLLRRLGLSAVVASLGGAAFGLNGAFSWLFHAPGNPIAFLPLLVLGVEEVRNDIAERHRLGRSWLLVAVPVTLSLYAGFPEVAAIDGLFAAVWAGLRLAGLSLPQVWRYLRGLALAALLGVVLAAPLLVPFADYVRVAFLGAHTQAIADFSVPRWGLPALGMPYVYGPIFGNTTPKLALFWDNVGGYVSLAAGLLAVFGLAGRRLRGLRIGLAAWVLVGLLRSYNFTFAVHALAAVPGLRSIAFYRYAMASWCLAVIVLAALAIEDLRQDRIARTWMLGVSVAAVAAVGLGNRYALHTIDTSGGPAILQGWTRFATVWALVLVAGVAVFSLLRSRPGKVYGIGALLLVDVVGSFLVPQLSAPRSASLDMRPVNFLRQNLGSYRFFPFGVLNPNYGSYFGLQSVAANDLPMPNLFASYISGSLDPAVDPITFDGTAPTPTVAAKAFMDNLKAYEAVSVKYAVVPHGFVLPGATGAGLRLVFSDPLADIYRTPDPSPFFSAAGCTVQPQGISSVLTRCSGASRLVREELYMPGWSARVNGRPAPVGEDRHLVQSVPLRAGASTVTFAYSPPHIAAAVAVFAAGCVAAVVTLLFQALRSRRRAPGGAPERPDVAAVV